MRMSLGSSTEHVERATMIDLVRAVFRVLHMVGGFLAFAAAPLALLAVKGSRRHILAGRFFTIGMGMAAASAVLLSVIRSQLFLFLLGLLGLFFTATGYLAPRVGRGSQTSYRWDRALTAVGGMASLGLVGDGLVHSTLMAPFPTGLIFGSLGLWIVAAHWRWRGPADRLGWRIEHLTSLLAAYTVAWCIIFALYVRLLPRPAQWLVPAVLGIPAILWARQRFGPRNPRAARDPGAGALT
jgi:hypothetical protein